MKKYLISLVVAILFLQHSVLFCFTPNPGDSTWSILNDIGQTIDNAEPGGDCEPRTKIYDPGSGNTHTIDTPGNYIVVEDFVNGKIVISADDVDLDLNGRDIAADVGLTDYIILVSGARKYISIYNGYVSETSVDRHGYGIDISAGSSVIQLKGLTVSGCRSGIYLLGTSGNEVVDCSIIDCDLLNVSSGMSLEYVKESFVSFCRIIDSISAGIFLRYSDYNSICDCSVFGVNAPIQAIGFSVFPGVGNSFVRCVAENIQSGNTAYGFAFTGGSDNNIIDCLVSGVTAINMYGIRVQSNATGCTLQNNTLINCGVAISGDDANVFDSDLNVAIQNISFNNSESSADYENVFNINDYYVHGADDIGHMENSYVTWS